MLTHVGGHICLQTQLGCRRGWVPHVGRVDALGSTPTMGLGVDAFTPNLGMGEDTSTPNSAVGMDASRPNIGVGVAVCPKLGVDVSRPNLGLGMAVSSPCVTWRRSAPRKGRSTEAPAVLACVAPAPGAHSP
jgi:hypothetical protein